MASDDLPSRPDAGAVWRMLVHGVVQGVGYRASMVRQARGLGLTGWVRNRADGRVEALLAGNPEAVDRLLQWARRGPPGAMVNAVDVTHEAGQDPAALPDPFEQWPTT